MKIISLFQAGEASVMKPSLLRKVEAELDDDDALVG